MNFRFVGSWVVHTYVFVIISGIIGFGIGWVRCGFIGIFGLGVLGL